MQAKSLTIADAWLITNQIFSCPSSAPLVVTSPLLFCTQVDLRAVAFCKVEKRGSRSGLKGKINRSYNSILRVNDSLYKPQTFAANMESKSDEHLAEYPVEPC